MGKALEDLESYDGEDANQFDYDFNNSLSEIRYELGKTNPSYYKLAIQSCEEVVSYIKGNLNILQAEGDNESLTTYRKSYEEKMCRIAEIYGVQGDFDNAVKTFKEAEDELSKAGDAANENLARVYTRHLMYVYQTFADKENDITKWSATNRSTILEIYEAGRKVPGIEKNSNWVKRVSDMDTLESMRSGAGTTTEEKGE